MFRKFFRKLARVLRIRGRERTVNTLAGPRRFRETVDTTAVRASGDAVVSSPVDTLRRSSSSNLTGADTMAATGVAISMGGGFSGGGCDAGAGGACGGGM